MSQPSAPAAAAPPRTGPERKSLVAECKSISDSGEFEFYAAVFGNLDRDGDIIVAGAFKNLDEFLADGFVSFDHRWGDVPIAYPVEAVQDSKGLKVRAKFHSTPKAQEVRTWASERIAAGKNVKCSVGYKIVDAAFEMRNNKPVRLLKSLIVLEAGPTNIPANPSAEAMGVKGLASLDQLAAMVTEYKRGKTLSSSNHGKLMEWAKGLHAHGKAACAMAKDVQAWLSSIDPDATEDLDDDGDSGDDTDADGKSASARLAALKARAVRGRASAACP